MNKAMFYRGRIKSAYGKYLSDNGMSVVRIYDNYVKALSSTCANKSCGYKYLLKLIPYLNKEYNVTCKYVLSTEPATMEPLRKTNVAKAVGLESPAANSIIKALSGLYIQCENYREPAVLFDKCDVFEFRYPSIVVNPRLIYAGDERTHTELFEMFDKRRIYDEQYMEENMKSFESNSTIYIADEKNIAKTFGEIDPGTFFSTTSGAHYIKLVPVSPEDDAYRAVDLSSGEEVDLPDETAILPSAQVVVF